VLPGRDESRPQNLWIPAFAGMTTKGKIFGKHQKVSFAMFNCRINIIRELTNGKQKAKNLNALKLLIEMCL